VTRKPNRTTVSLALTLPPTAKAKVIRLAARNETSVSKWFLELLETTNEWTLDPKPTANATEIAIEGSRLSKSLRDLERLGVAADDALCAEARLLLSRMAVRLARLSEIYDAALDAEEEVGAA
jgi:hypothetical protein